MFGSFFSLCDLTLLMLFSQLPGIPGDCGPPPKLSNAIPLGKVDGESFHPNQSVTYKCLDSFYNVHRKLDVITCLSDSQWTPIEEFCERICSRPPRTKFAKIKAEDLKTYYPAKTRVTYVCRPGYNIIPGINSIITCLDNYTWTALPVFCEGKSCGDPGKPEHGEVVILTDFLFSATVNFSCKEGYRLIGSSSTHCVLEEDRVEWEAKPPECQQIICSSPPNVTNASHDGRSTGNFTYNSTVTYHCDHGFLIIGEASIRCTTEDNVTGVWRGSAPACKDITPLTTPMLITKEPPEKEGNLTRGNYSTMVQSPVEKQGDCPSPPNEPHSTLDTEWKENYPVGTRLRFSCIPGYQFSSDSVPSIRCLDSGWSTFHIRCERKRCRPPEVQNGGIEPIDNLYFGDEITYVCDSGYRPLGKKTARCTLVEDNKVQWDTDPPLCERIACERPPGIVNGTHSGDLSLDHYTVGDVVTYTCDHGLSLIGESSITCIVAEDGETGTWDNPAPECKAVQCSRTQIENGRQTSAFRSTYNYKHVLYFVCDSGYELVGNVSVTCEADSEWHPRLPKCVKKPEEPTKKPTVRPTVRPTPDSKEETITKEGSTQSPGGTVPKDDSGDNKIVGIVIGVSVAVVALIAAVVIIIKLRPCQKKGKHDCHPSSLDSYRTVPGKDIALEGK